MSRVVAAWIAERRAYRPEWKDVYRPLGLDPLDLLAEGLDGFLESVYAELCVRYPDLPEQAARLRAERPVRRTFRYTAKEAAARSRRAKANFAGRPRKTVVPSA